MVEKTTREELKDITHIFGMGDTAPDGIYREVIACRIKKGEMTLLTTRTEYDKADPFITEVLLTPECLEILAEVVRVAASDEMLNHPVPVDE